jgi:hypothetical protein
MDVMAPLRAFKDGDSGKTQGVPGKQPYDRDKAPAGYDPAFWDLALKFEDRAEEVMADEMTYSHGRDRFVIPGRIIVYSEIKARAGRMKLADLDILAEMIGRFWDYEYAKCDSSYKLQEFCTRSMFEYLHDWVLDQRELERIKTAPRIKQENHTRRTDIPKREKDGRRKDTDQRGNEGEYTAPPDLSKLKQRLAVIFGGISTSGP